MAAFDSTPSPRVREKLMRRIGYVPADPWLARLYLFLVDCCSLLAIFCALFAVAAVADSPEGFAFGVISLVIIALAWGVGVGILTAFYSILRPFFDGVRY